MGSTLWQILEKHCPSFHALKKFTLAQLLSTENTIQQTQRTPQTTSTWAQYSRLDITHALKLLLSTRGQSKIFLPSARLLAAFDKTSRKRVSKVNLVKGYSKNTQTLYLFKLSTTKSKITIDGSMGRDRLTTNGDCLPRILPRVPL